jgi:thioredoxin-like negative regulator of GroEL
MAHTATALVPSSHKILIPLERRAHRALLLVVALAVAGSLGGHIVRPAVATSLAARATSVRDFERALAWDPKNPTLNSRLARAYAQAGDDAQAVARFDTALRLRPTDAMTWLHLALYRNRAGDRHGANAALERALSLDQHNVAVRWEAALLAIRWGHGERALEHLRYVLAVDATQRDAAFQLARMLLRPGDDAASLLPAEPQALTNVLVAAVSNQDSTLAGAAWTRRASLRPAVPQDVSRRYLDFLLAEGDGRTARRVWGALMPGDSTNLVFNGGFENERLLGWGLDWRVSRVWGVEVVVDRFVASTGRHSLRLAFNSFPTLNFSGVSQLVSVEPGREYRLRAVVRASDFITRSGLKLEVVLPRTEQVLAQTLSVAGTTQGWTPLETRVRVPADTSLVQLRLRREPAALPEGNLGGKVWIDDVRLE